jgi:hypothetical protein
MHVQVTDDPQVGTEVAGYRIEALLGLGGMSVVYLAEEFFGSDKVEITVFSGRSTA